MFTERISSQDAAAAAGPCGIKQTHGKHTIKIIIKKKYTHCSNFKMFQSGTKRRIVM